MIADVATKPEKDYLATLPQDAGSTGTFGVYYVVQTEPNANFRTRRKVRLGLLASQYTRFEMPNVPNEVGSARTLGDVSAAQLQLLRRNKAAIALIKRWLSEDSDYDETVWPIVKRGIEESRTSSRSRFGD